MKFLHLKLKCLFSTSTTTEFIKNNLEIPSFAKSLIYSFSSNYAYNHCSGQLASIYSFCEKLVMVWRKYSFLNAEPTESFLARQNIILNQMNNSIMQFNAPQFQLPFHTANGFVMEALRQYEDFLENFNSTFKPDATFKSSFQLSDAFYNELMQIFAGLSKNSSITVHSLSLFLQSTFRFAFSKNSEDLKQFLILSNEDRSTFLSGNLIPSQSTSLPPINMMGLKEPCNSFLLYSINYCKAYQMESFLLALAQPDSKRLSVLRPNSPFLLSLRILEKSNPEYIFNITNRLFVKITLTEAHLKIFYKKKLLLHEMLGQIIYNHKLPSSDLDRLLPAFTASLNQLVFHYLSTSTNTKEKESIANDIVEFFGQMKKFERNSLPAYLIYMKFLKSAKAISQVRSLELEMNTSDWIDKTERMRDFTEEIPQTDSELISHIHYYLYNMIDDTIPNSSFFSLKTNTVSTFLIPLSVSDSRDLAFVFLYSKFKLWADVFRIYSSAKDTNRLDIPFSGGVRNPIFHYTFSSILFRNVINNLSWTEASAFLDLPSALLSRDGFKLLYSHLYSYLFTLLIKYDKFLLIQSIVSIPRAHYLSDDYLLPSALSTLVCSSRRGSKSYPNRVLFYKLLSNRLDIDITCQSSPTPPSFMASILQAVDGELSNLLYFIELHSLPLGPNNITVIATFLFRLHRYDLICQLFGGFDGLECYHPLFHQILFVAALKDRQYKLIYELMGKNALKCYIPGEDKLHSILTQKKSLDILPSSMQVTTAFDLWRKHGLLGDHDYSESLSICQNYYLGTLFFVRRYIQIQQEESRCKAGGTLKATFPNAVVVLVSIPQDLLNYEMEYFPQKKKSAQEGEESFSLDEKDEQQTEQLYELYTDFS